MDKYRARPSAISFVAEDSDDKTQKDATAAERSGKGTPPPAFSRSGSFRRASIGSETGSERSRITTSKHDGKSTHGSSTHGGHGVVHNDREIVNGIMFPSVVAKKIPRYLKRNNSETFIIQCFVDLYLQPPAPLPVDPNAQTATGTDNNAQPK